MTKTPEVATVIRNKNDEVVAIIVTQLKTKTHVFYKTEKMGVEEITELIRDEDKNFGMAKKTPEEIAKALEKDEQSV